MKKIALAAIALFMMVSCSDDGSSGNVNENVLLKKVVYTGDSDVVESYEYAYDGNKMTTLTMKHDEHVIAEINYTYDDNKLSGSETVSGGEITQRTFNAYNPQGKLSSVTKFNYHPTQVFSNRTEYIYNSDNTVTTKYYTGGEDGPTEYRSEGLIKFNNGNIVKRSGNDDATYTHDNKNSPLRNVFAIDVMNMIQGEGGPNNIRTFISNGNPVYTMTYTYNGDNFPVTTQMDWGDRIAYGTYYYE